MIQSNKLKQLQAEYNQLTHLDDLYHKNNHKEELLTMTMNETLNYKQSNISSIVKYSQNDEPWKRSSIHKIAICYKPSSISINNQSILAEEHKKKNKIKQIILLILCIFN